MNKLALFASTPAGVFVILVTAAYLEAQGDAYMQSALHHSAGPKRLGLFTLGTALLFCYSLFLNSSRIDFGKLIGLYVVVFFLVAQVVAKVQFSQSPTKPVYLGGGLIVLGGLIMTIWNTPAQTN